MNQLLYRIVLLAVLLWPVLAKAQSPAAVGRDSMVLMTHIDAGGVVHLRWSPPLPSVYYAGLEQGYRVERRVAGGPWELLSDEVVKPLSTQALLKQTSGNPWMQMLAMSTQPDSLTETGDMPAGPRRQLKQGQERYQLVSIAFLATIYDRPTALASGTYRIDSTGLTGIVDYRVSAPAGVTGIAPGRTRVDLDAPTRTARLYEVDYAWGDREVDLSWTLPESDEVAYVEVQRQVRGDAAWRTVSMAPIVGAPGELSSFSDTLRDNATDYAYRLLAYDYFHSRPTPSPVVEGRGVPPMTADAPVIDSIYEVAERTVVIEWSLPEGTEASDISGVQVMRSRQPGAGYIAISEPMSGRKGRWTQQLDDPAITYFRLQASDPYGRRVTSGGMSFQLLDTVPPMAPVNLLGEVGRDGVVTLRWDQNDEPDVLGYRVFFMNNRGGVLARRNPAPLTLPLWTDSLDLISLYDTAYYRVAAMDFRQNVSELSEVYALTLPDVHQPAAPILTSALGSLEGVALSYLPSGSSDVAFYNVRRRLEGTHTWETIARLDTSVARSGAYLDTTGLAGYNHEYQLEVRDDAGIRNLSNVVRAAHLLPTALPAVKDLQTQLDPEARAMRLRWRYPLDPRLRRFRILRASEGVPLQTVATVAIEDLARKGPNRRDQSYLWRALDANVTLGVEYQYVIQAEWADGRVSKL